MTEMYFQLVINQRYTPLRSGSVFCGNFRKYLYTDFQTSKLQLWHRTRWKSRNVC